MVKLESPPFVNRHQELLLIQEKLQAIQKARYLFGFILTISGVPGIGKTYLLQESQKVAKEIDIRTVFFDYEKDRMSQTPLYVLQRIANELFKSAPDWQEAVREYQGNQGHPSQYAFYQGRVIAAFVKHLKLQLEQTPLLLLLDNSHRMTEAAQEVLEDVLERLYQDNRRFLIILAGRSDIRWHSFELRRRTTNLVLGTFPKNENDELLLSLGYDTLKDQVYAVTRGYPKATVLTSQWVADHFKPSDIDLSSHFKAQEAELVFDLFDAIFEEYILRDIENPETRRWLSQLLRYVSPLRRFDDNLLAALLRNLDADTFGQINTLDARAFTRQMAVYTYLVKWNSDKQAYALDAPMRRLLSLELKFRDKSRLVQIHHFAANWYQQAIDEVTRQEPSAPQSVVYLLEHIFHWVQVRQLQNETVGLETDIKQKINDRFKGYYPREQARFRDEFSKDEDLAELLGESYHRLMEFVSQKVELKSQG